MKTKHENILERILPVPHGYDLVAIEDNKMVLAKKNTIFKYKGTYYKRRGN